MSQEKCEILDTTTNKSDFRHIDRAEPAVELFEHMLHFTPYKFNKYREELQQCGVIFKMKTGYGIAREDNEGRKVRWWAFPTKVMRWAGIKGFRCETI